jgi:hypothetical protein
MSIHPNYDKEEGRWKNNDKVNQFVDDVLDIWEEGVSRSFNTQTDPFLGNEGNQLKQNYITKNKSELINLAKDFLTEEGYKIA